MFCILEPAMRSIDSLRRGLERLASAEAYLFSTGDLKALLPDLSPDAFRALISRATRAGVLERLCRDIYIYSYPGRPRGFELYHAAARLRAGSLTYISLESALSDLGIISQVPVATITLMTTGRSNRISCGRYGVIELVHTAQPPNSFMHELTYDESCRLWRASPARALRDLRATGRSLDLVDWSLAHELLQRV